MPFIVTTSTDRPAAGSRNRTFVILSRRAVATLEEARRWVTRGISDSGRKAGSTDYATVAAMSDDGCSVGPLPDGTLLVVEPRDRHWFIEELLIDEKSLPSAEWPWTTDRLVAAWNERERTKK